MSPKFHTINVCGAGLLLLLAGCNRHGRDENASTAGTLPALVALGAKPGAAIVAQGQIEPSKGVLPIVAAPGDRVESILVTEGQEIKAGDILGRMASQEAKELELEIAIARRDEAVAKLKAEEAAAASWRCSPNSSQSPKPNSSNCEPLRPIATPAV
jgi:multidrug efflux pump subunit AcrA (membrane-fusion protein)